MPENFVAPEVMVDRVEVASEYVKPTKNIVYTGDEALSFRESLIESINSRKRLDVTIDERWRTNHSQLRLTNIEAEAYHYYRDSMHKAAQQANWCLLHLANNPTVAVSTAFELTINGLDDLAKTANRLMNFTLDCLPLDVNRQRTTLSQSVEGNKAIVYRYEGTRKKSQCSVKLECVNYENINLVFYTDRVCTAREFQTENNITDLRDGNGVFKFYITENVIRFTADTDLIKDFTFDETFILPSFTAIKLGLEEQPATLEKGAFSKRYIWQKEYLAAQVPVHQAIIIQQLLINQLRQLYKEEL